MRSIMAVSTASLFSTSPVNPTNPHIGVSFSAAARAYRNFSLFANFL